MNWLPIKGFENLYQVSQQTKPVKQYSLDGQFIKQYQSITQVSKELQISSGAISNAVLGRTKTCKGFIWKSE